MCTYQGEKLSNRPQMISSELEIIESQLETRNVRQPMCWTQSRIIFNLLEDILTELQTSACQRRMSMSHYEVINSQLQGICGRLQRYQQQANTIEVQMMRTHTWVISIQMLVISIQQKILTIQEKRIRSRMQQIFLGRLLEAEDSAAKKVVETQTEMIKTNSEMMRTQLEMNKTQILMIRTRLRMSGCPQRTSTTVGNQLRILQNAVAQRQFVLSAIHTLISILEFSYNQQQMALDQIPRILSRQETADGGSGK